MKRNAKGQFVKPNELIAFDGRRCFLSKEKYVVLSDLCHLKRGEVVQKISGVDRSQTPGYHFERGYTTVCRADAQTAEFCGVALHEILLLKNI